MNYVIIDRERCKGCQICIEFAPGKSCLSRRKSTATVTIRPK